MPQEIKIKNTTLSRGTWVGKRVESLEIITIPTSMITIWDNEDVITSLTNGDLVIIENETPETYYTVAKAIRIIQGLPPEVIAGGNTNEVLVSNDTGDVLVWDNKSNSFVGGLHQMTFIYDKTTKNRWLGLYDKQNPSDSIFGVMPWASKLVGITFTNEYYDTDTKIKIYSTPEGGRASPKTLDYEWALINARVARKTNFSTDVLFDAGDKIGIYLEDCGNDAYDPVVQLYFVITDDTVSEHVESFWEYFTAYSGGGT